MSIAVEVDEESLGMDVRLIVLTSATSACPWSHQHLRGSGARRPWSLLNIGYSTLGHSDNHKQRNMARFANPDARRRCYVHDSPNPYVRTTHGLSCTRSALQ